MYVIGAVVGLTHIFFIGAYLALFVLLPILVYVLLQDIKRYKRIKKKFPVIAVKTNILKELVSSEYGVRLENAFTIEEVHEVIIDFCNKYNMTVEEVEL